MRCAVIGVVLVLVPVTGCGGDGCDEVLDGRGLPSTAQLVDETAVAVVGVVTATDEPHDPTISLPAEVEARDHVVALEQVLWADDAQIVPGGSVAVTSSSSGCLGDGVEWSTGDRVLLTLTRFNLTPGERVLTVSFPFGHDQWDIDADGVATNQHRPELSGIPVDTVADALLAARSNRTS